MSFKETHSHAVRLQESRRIRDKFPGRIPVIVERANKNIQSLDKSKFLCPADLTLGQFAFVIRRRMSLPPETAMFLFVNNTLPTTSQLMRELYAMYADVDGFMYVTYSGENTFG